MRGLLTGEVQHQAYHQTDGNDEDNYEGDTYGNIWPWITLGEIPSPTLLALHTKHGR